MIDEFRILIGTFLLGLTLSCGAESDNSTDAVSKIDVDKLLEEVAAGAANSEPLLSREHPECTYLNKIESFLAEPLEVRFDKRTSAEDLRFMLLVGGFLPQAHGFETEEERLCVQAHYKAELVEGVSDGIMCKDEAVISGLIREYTSKYNNLLKQYLVANHEYECAT